MVLQQINEPSLLAGHNLERGSKVDRELMLKDTNINAIYDLSSKVVVSVLDVAM